MWNSRKAQIEFDNSVWRHVSLRFPKEGDRKMNVCSFGIILSGGFNLWIIFMLCCFKVLIKCKNFSSPDGFCAHLCSCHGDKWRDSPNYDWKHKCRQPLVNHNHDLPQNHVQLRAPEMEEIAFNIMLLKYEWNIYICFCYGVIPTMLWHFYISRSTIIKFWIKMCLCSF